MLTYYYVGVALRVRAWIETFLGSPEDKYHPVALRVRAWIETLLHDAKITIISSPSA